MRRLVLLVMVASLLFTAGAGCSNAKKSRRSTASTKSSSRRTSNKPGYSKPLPTLGGSPSGSTTKLRNVSGPKTMGGLMVDSWKADLTSPSTEKRILAANELGNMGPSAKSALPSLQTLARDRNPQVAAAAKAAIAKINR